MCTHTCTCTSTDTLRRVRGLRVRPFSITSPCRQESDSNIIIECLEHDISETEVYQASQALQNGKAFGPDGTTKRRFQTSFESY